MEPYRYIQIGHQFHFHSLRVSVSITFELFEAQSEQPCKLGSVKNLTESELITILKQIKITRIEEMRALQNDKKYAKIKMCKFFIITISVQL